MSVRPLLVLILFLGGVAKGHAQDLLPAQLGGVWCAEAKTQHAAQLQSFRIQQHAAPRGYDATYYHLDLAVTVDPPYLSGTTRIAARTTDVLDHLDLDLAANMQVDSVRTADGMPLDFSRDGDVLRVMLPETAAPDERVAFDVAYQGVPRQEGGFGTFVFEADGFWTLSEPYGARNWWPSNDHPSDKADSVRVTVTVPQPIIVGSQGLLAAATPNADGTITYDWHSRYPITSYLVSLAAGTYDVFEQTYTRPDSLAVRHGPLDLPILHYAYRNSFAFEGGDVFSGWRRVTEVFPVMEDWFGPYPFPDEKYGHAHVTFPGGMEHQTMSSMGSSGIGLIVHELAHQWFGDAVSPTTWPHLWLNEGFATFAELIYWQKRSDLYGDTYDRIFDLYYNRALTAEGTLVVQDTTDIRELFRHARVYSKGGMVLHMLRQMLGDHTMQQVLRTYAADPTVQYGTATTADFQRAAEQVTGADYDRFFRQWVTEGTGYPDYRATWGFEEQFGLYVVTIDLEQVQTLPASNVDVFEMPITFAIQTTDGERRQTVLNDQRQQRVVLLTNAEPVAVILDPDRALLRAPETEVVSRDVPRSSPSVLAFTAYPNPAGEQVTVAFSLPTPGAVRLDLYDSQGRRVRRLWEGYLPAGPHHRTLSLAGTAAGVYTLRVHTPAGIHAQPLIHR